MANKQFFTEQTHFYGNTRPQDLLAQYGSPLYVYNEAILRARCQDMVGLVDYRPFSADYSCKANSNLHLLRIIREEGLEADAMSPGEMQVLLAAGFAPEQILFVCNNVSTQEMAYAVERGITVSVDSISQLDQFGRAFPGRRVAARLNVGHGAGHHEKVVTAGKRTKFGINSEMLDTLQTVVRRHNLKLVGFNQHIGSLFMDETAYAASAEQLMQTAMRFEHLEFIDMGGGFGIPYMKQDGQAPLDLAPFRARLNATMEDFAHRYGKRVKFRSEPGRYVVAECGVLLGTVHALKEHAGVNYVGTDLGFNVLMRPVLYDSYHDIEVYRGNQLARTGSDTVNIVGTICESGDTLAEDRTLPEFYAGDALGVMDAGAYGYSMASNYNNRLRPAEVLIGLDGQARLIRRRDRIEDLLAPFDV